MIGKTYKDIKIDRIMLFGDPATANVYFGFINDIKTEKVVPRIVEKEIEEKVTGVDTEGKPLTVLVKKKIQKEVLDVVSITTERLETTKDCQLTFSPEELKIVEGFQKLILNKIKKQEGI